MAMEKNYLIINIGSSSIRYALYANATQKFFVHYIKEENEYRASISDESTSEKNNIRAASLHDTVKYISQVTSVNLTAIAIRVVAPGHYFTRNRIIDDECIARLNKIIKAAPLHIKPVLEIIESCQFIYKNVPVIAISDSSFHTTISHFAKIYALPTSLANEHELYKYGYHGISISSVKSVYQKEFGALPARTIVCHLGSGTSITALKDGKSVDTSMGFTPYAGIPMASRIGDIDPGLVTYLGELTGYSYLKLDNFFNNQCGLLGITEQTGDMEKILELYRQNDTQATLALDAYVYSITKYIGSYCAVLGGLDLLVFTGGIGENSPIVRSLICKNLSWCSIDIDENKNNTLENNCFIELEGTTSIAVIATQEMNTLCHELKNFI